MDRLLEWLQSGDNGHVSPSIEVRNIPGSGRGVFATAPISAGSRLVTVPRRFLLNIDTVRDHLVRDHLVRESPPDDPPCDEFAPFYAALLRQFPTLLAFQIVAVYLCVESRRRDSFWAPFISCLPQLSDFEQCPLVRTQRALDGHRAYLDLLPALTQALAALVCDRFERDYSVVAALVQPFPAITSLCVRDRFLWAWMCINSRCLYMQQPLALTNDDNFTMAPLVDFLNHSPADACRIRIDAAGFTVFATAPHHIGDQLLFCYGPHANEFLLAEYGFVLDSPTVYNTIDVTPQLAPLLLPLQAEYLRSAGYLGDYTISHDGCSFRTQVALATILEPDPRRSRPLSAFLNGHTDGSVYRNRSDALLNQALAPVIRDSQHKLALLHSTPYAAARALHQNILDIAYSYQCNL